MPTRTRRTSLALVAAILTTSLSAQVPNPPSTRLGKISGLRCTFTTMATSDWKAGKPETAVKPATLAVSFTEVDTQEGTAVASSNLGKSHLTVRLLGSYLHLMQMDPYGALYVTTVFDAEARAGRLRAVHTRHEYTPVTVPGFTSRPEHYVGECEASSK